MRVGVLGSGDVAKVLASGCLKHGHDVMMGTRTPAKLTEWAKRNPQGRVGSFADAATFAELVVLAVKGTVAADALGAAGGANMAGKPVIDATNPIADVPPTNGVLKFFTTLEESLMERLQRQFRASVEWARCLPVHRARYPRHFDGAVAVQQAIAHAVLNA